MLALGIFVQVFVVIVLTLGGMARDIIAYLYYLDWRPVRKRTLPARTCCYSVVPGIKAMLMIHSHVSQVLATPKRRIGHKRRKGIFIGLDLQGPVSEAFLMLSSYLLTHKY